VAATSNDAAASAHGLDCPVVSWSQRSQRSFMINHTGGWMSGWMGGGMWIYTVFGVVVVVLLVVVITKLYNKKS
jgi:uncharacterized membrane protein